MTGHDPFIPAARVGDFTCAVCGMRLGTFQRRPGMDTLLWWDDTLMPACAGKPVQASRRDDEQMHENCREAVLTWWYMRQGAKIDRLANQESLPARQQTLSIEASPVVQST